MRIQIYFARRYKIWYHGHWIGGSGKRHRCVMLAMSTQSRPTSPCRCILVESFRLEDSTWGGVWCWVPRLASLDILECDGLNRRQGRIGEEANEISRCVRFKSRFPHTVPNCWCQKSGVNLDKGSVVSSAGQRELRTFGKAGPSVTKWSCRRKMEEAIIKLRVSMWCLPKALRYLSQQVWVTQ